MQKHADKNAMLTLRTSFAVKLILRLGTWPILPHWLWLGQISKVVAKIVVFEVLTCIAGLPRGQRGPISILLVQLLQHLLRPSSP